MIYVSIHHKVADYKKWKPIFDKEATHLKEAGCQRFAVYSKEGDTNDVTVIAEWDSTDNAKKFFDSPRLKQVMLQSGVVGQAQIAYLSRLEKKHLVESKIQAA